MTTSESTPLTDRTGGAPAREAVLRDVLQVISRSRADEAQVCEGRYDCPASGTAVNPAAGLCDQAADQEILLSQRTATALENVADVESTDELTLKGFHAPVDVFRVTAKRDAP